MYTTQEKIEAYLGRDITDDELVILNDVIETVTKFINDYTNRTWGNTVTEPRTFDGSGNKELFLPNFTDVTKIELLDTLGGAVLELDVPDSVVYYPINETVYTSIRRRSGTFPRRPHSVRITATWGSGALPNPVSLSATMLAANYLSTKKDNLTGFKKESIEGYSYELLSGAESSEKVSKALSYLGSYKRIVL